MRAVTALLLAALAAACSRKVVVTSEPPGPSTAVTLGIPPGHLPPPGECRVWIPGRPPGQQSPPGDCRVLEGRVPQGAWLVYRPTKDRKTVRVSVYDDRSPRVIVIRYFEAETGKLLREEEP